MTHLGSHSEVVGIEKERKIASAIIGVRVGA